MIRITIAADDDKRVDMIPGECHLERIEREIDIGSIFVAARRQVPLHHLNRVLRHAPAVFTRALPIAISDFRHDLAALLDGFKNRTDVEVSTESTFDSDFNVVEVHEHGDVQTILVRQTELPCM